MPSGAEVADCALKLIVMIVTHTESSASRQYLN